MAPSSLSSTASTMRAAVMRSSLAANQRCRSKNGGSTSRSTMARTGGFRMSPTLTRDQGPELGEGIRERAAPMRQLCRPGEDKPVETVAGKRQLVGQLADRRKCAPPHQLDWDASARPAKVELDCLSRM